MGNTGLFAHVRAVVIDSPTNAVLYLACVLIAYNVVHSVVLIIYNLYFHPLRDVPGPRLAAAADLYKNYYALTGRGPYHDLQMHKQYGPIVRVAPNLVQFADPQAWRDIYGHRTGGKPATIKPIAIEPAHKGHEMLEFIPSEEEHGIRRRLYAHAFSDQAIKKQEPMLNEHVDALITQLRSKTKESPNRSQNIVEWLHFCTFDIMGDLAFGHGMSMVSDAKYNPWVAAIIGSFKPFTTSFILSQYQPFSFLIKNTYLGTIVKKAVDDHRRFARERVDQRLDSEVDRPDIWGLVMKASPDRLPSRWAMHEDGMLFMQAGTDTTATLLCGLLYWLLKTPSTLNKLQEEVRNVFKSSSDEFTLEKLAKLSYMVACIEEGLRIYPPVPPGIPRLAPPGGIAVCGRFYDEGVSDMQCLAVPQYGAYHYEGNFALPDEFHPERWLGKDPQFVNDKKDAFQPFLYGPRNCIGKNLAYNEMRLILAKIIVNFDLALESKDWIPHEAYGLWQKPPLFIRFTPRD